MKPKTLILLVVAIGCGLVASYMTSRVIADRAPPPETTKVPVVYAIKSAPQGLFIKNPEDYFQQRMIPDDVAPGGKVIRELSELKDKRLINPVGADKHVSFDDLLDSTKEGGLSYRIPPNMRAVSVKVTQDGSVGGFVLPGMFVDIICIPNGRNEAKTIMQRVQVLAVNNLQGKDQDGKPHIETHYVTFAVTPGEGERLALATHSGHLRLTMRHTDDDKVALTPGAKQEDLSRPPLDLSDGFNQPDSVQPTPVPVAPTVTADTTVSKPDTPSQPKVIWTMTIQQGPQVKKIQYFDEQPVSVEKSDPEADSETPKTPVRKPIKDIDEESPAPPTSGKK
jgi:pilus assembly protein CpaB